MAADNTTPPKKKAATDPKSNAPNGNSQKPEPPKTFQGEVVKVAADASGNEGKLWVKHADGTIKLFHIHSSTKLSGAPALKAVTKGSMVTVEHVKKGTNIVNVTKLAPPAAPDKTHGGPVNGTVVKVHSDAYGDTGSLSVKTAKGTIRDFQVTNATVVEHPDHKDLVHSLQFVAAGDTVTVEHDAGKIALHVAVTATVHKK
jgi:hypothetical protein